MRMSIISLGGTALHGMLEAEKHSEVHTTAILLPTESKDLFLYSGVTQITSFTKVSHRSPPPLGCHRVPHPLRYHVEPVLHSGIT